MLCHLNVGCCVVFVLGWLKLAFGVGHKRVVGVVKLVRIGKSGLML